MKRYLISLLIVLVAAPLLLFGATKITSTIIDKSAIFNSTVDSCPIGSINPSTARFLWTKIIDSTPIGAGTANQGLYTFWNSSHTFGEATWYNQSGNGPGGYQWYNVPGTTGVPSLLMSLLPDGTLQGKFQGNLLGNATSAVGFDHVPSNCGAGFYSTGVTTTGEANCVAIPQTYTWLRAAITAAPVNGAGLWFGWNGSGGRGESNFLNERGGGVGGFTWVETDMVNNVQTMALDAAGNLTLAGGLSSPSTVSAATVSASGNVSAVGTVSGTSGNFTGANMGTATVSGSLTASSATVSGNASVGTLTAGNIQRAWGGGCIAGASSYSSCVVNINWPSAFPDGSYAATCSGVGATDPRAYIGNVSKFNWGVQVTVVNGGSQSGVGFNEVDCIGIR